MESLSNDWITNMQGGSEILFRDSGIRLQNADRLQRELR